MKIGALAVVLISICSHFMTAHAEARGQKWIQLKDVSNRGEFIAILGVSAPQPPPLGIRAPIVEDRRKEIGELFQLSYRDKLVYCLEKSMLIGSFPESPASFRIRMIWPGNSGTKKLSKPQDIVISRTIYERPSAVSDLNKKSIDELRNCLSDPGKGLIPRMRAPRSALDLRIEIKVIAQANVFRLDQY